MRENDIYVGQHGFSAGLCCKILAIDSYIKCFGLIHNRLNWSKTFIHLLVYCCMYVLFGCSLIINP